MVLEHDYFEQELIKNQDKVYLSLHSCVFAEEHFWGNPENLIDFAYFENCRFNCSIEELFNYKIKDATFKDCRFQQTQINSSDRSILKSLQFWNCGLTNDFIQHLHFQKIEILDLAGNLIREFPLRLLNMPQIRGLDLSRNRIEIVPDQITDYNVEVSLKDNPIKNVPEEILKYGYQAVLKYFFTKHKERLSFYQEVPDLFRTAIIQYLQFFNDFLRKIKRIEASVNMYQANGGIRIEIPRLYAEQMEAIVPRFRNIHL